MLNGSSPKRAESYGRVGCSSPPSPRGSPRTTSRRASSTGSWGPLPWHPSPRERLRSAKPHSRPPPASSRSLATRPNPCSGAIPETFVGVFAFLRLSAGPVLPGPLTSHRPPLHRPGGVVAAGMAGNAIHRRGRQRRRGQRRGEPGRKERRVELRADLHLHTRERERFIAYDARDLID